MVARLIKGDCLAAMREMHAQGERVDAIVTDPPYELAFMGQAWDGTGVAFQVETWRLAYDVLKPGGYLIAMAGTRTYHRMVCAIEDAGFEIRDQIGWCYAMGFPKSLNVSLAIDDHFFYEWLDAHPLQRLRLKCVKGDAREALEADLRREAGVAPSPATPEAAQWAGWGTALKPAWEPICVARRPLGEPTVAANVLVHGTGGINVDACRIEVSEPRPLVKRDHQYRPENFDIPSGSRAAGFSVEGRWPANLVHDGSPEVMEAFAAFGERAVSGSAKAGTRSKARAGGEVFKSERGQGPLHNDTGTAARFFYSAKASQAERAGSKHPTVKPVSLMRWLVTLVTPPGGTVLDMFAGTGTTLQAALEAGVHAIGIEKELEYQADIERRLATCGAISAYNAQMSDGLSQLGDHDDRQHER